MQITLIKTQMGKPMLKLKQRSIVWADIRTVWPVDDVNFKAENSNANGSGRSGLALLMPLHKLFLNNVASNADTVESITNANAKY